MFLRYLLVFTLIIIWGCAAYKELQPVPEVAFIENGYIELEDDGEYFELSEGKKYFVKFPAPANENVFLVLNISSKPDLTTFMTRVFDDGEGTIIKMADESEQPENSSVYPLDRTVPTFYWVIEEVRKDLILNLQYRYIAAWRYKFESRHAEFQEILAENTHPRDVFTAIGTSISAQEIDYNGERSAVQERKTHLEAMQNQLGEIESIFPSDIINSSDASYQSYLKLRQDLAREHQFQTDYLALLSILESVSEAPINMHMYVQRAGEYSLFLNQTDKYPASVLNEGKKTISNHLINVAPFFEKELRKKNNTEPIEFNIEAISELYAACGRTPPENYLELANFVKLYNRRTGSLTKAKETLNLIYSELNKSGEWPVATFFTNQRAQLAKISYQLPPADTKEFGIYKTYACASLLNKEIRETATEINQLSGQIERAEQLVPQINLYKNQGNYSGILRLLKQNMDIRFLTKKYSDLDNLSLTQQKMGISDALQAQNWSQAELRLKNLHNDTNFLIPKSSIPKKNNLVKAYEDSMFNTIESISVKNATKFIQENLTATEDIDSLYLNPNLAPVYSLTFSSTSSTDLTKKQSVLKNRLDFLKHQKFPQSAIEQLYTAFTASLHDRGVEKARAIVSHGKYYQGDDQNIKNLIAECDPYAAKWLTKAKNYRKIYVLPTTTKIGGTNKYLLKLNIQIPSEAQFPVYDINVKLPMEIARHAGDIQWYERLTFNKKILKNEGRFTITAPSADNNYEMQITPLQVNKTGDNILELIFEYDSFKVFEMSVMAQRPIMKRN